jgi:hypothetical protein
LSRKIAQLTACLVLGAALVASSASAAQAASTAACDAGPLSQPFTPWADLAHYAQVPGGDFESGLGGWATSGDARVVTGNESWHVGGDDDSSLALANGASVTTPSFCGGLSYPTVRLFTRRAGASLLPLLSVSILYTGQDGALRSLPLGVAVPTASWQPTLPMLTLSGLPLLTGSRLALRITAIGGPIAIDDVYVDPFCRMR